MNTSATEQERPSILSGSYTVLLQIVCRLQRGGVSGNHQGQIHQYALQQLQQERRRLLRHLNERWVDACQLAITALVDEAARGNVDSDFSAAWSRQTLQGGLYGHENLGARVFEQLQTLQQDPATPVEVLELYLRCLLFGLQGEYAPNRLEQLAILRQALVAQVKTAQKPARLFGPSPVSRPQPPIPHLLAKRWILSIGAAALLVTMGGLAIKFMLEIHGTQKVLEELTLANTTVSGTHATTTNAQSEGGAP